MSGKRIKATGDRRGFAIVELLVVLVVLGIVANIAIPVFLHAQLKARATKIVTDFKYVESVVTTYYSQSGVWPRDRAPGVVPPELAAAIGGRLDWGQKGRRSMAIQYEWDNWINKNGNPLKPKTGVAVGFSVRTRDREMLAMIRNVWDRESYATRDRVTFIIEPVAR